MCLHLQMNEDGTHAMQCMCMWLTPTHMNTGSIYTEYNNSTWAISTVLYYSADTIHVHVHILQYSFCVIM